MPVVAIFFCYLFAFWAENILGFKLSPVTGLSLRNGALYLLFIVWAFEGVRNRKFFEPSKVNLYVLLLIAVVVASIPVKFLLDEVPDVEVFNELVNLKGWANPILLFIILYNSLHEERHCRLVIEGLVVFFVVTVISSVGVSGGFFHFGTLRVDKVRSAGFAEPNQYAAFLVLFLPLIYSRVAFAQTGKGRVWAAATLFLGFVSLVITGSRGGVIALVCASAMYIYVFSRLGLIRPMVSMGVLVIALPLLTVSAFLVAPTNVQDVVIERFNPGDKDSTELTSGRNLLWKGGWELFLQSPIVGHGQATYIPLMKKNFPIWGNSHNDYLLYLVHYGVIGLALYLMVLWALFREAQAYAAKSSDEQLQRASLSYIAGFAGYAVAMLGVNVIQPQFLFWAFSAAILKWGRVSCSRDNDEKEPEA